MSDVDEISERLKKMSVADRAWIMRQASFFSERKGVIKDVKPVRTRRGDETIRIQFESGADVFMSVVAIGKLLFSFEKKQREDVDEDEIIKLLVGKHVVVTERPTTDGVEVTARRDREHHPDEPPALPKPSEPFRWEKMGCDGGY